METAIVAIALTCQADLLIVFISEGEHSLSVEIFLCIASSVGCSGLAQATLLTWTVLHFNDLSEIVLYNPSQ